jgi:hypothetical protein
MFQEKARKDDEQHIVKGGYKWRREPSKRSVTRRSSPKSRKISRRLDNNVVRSLHFKLFTTSGCCRLWALIYLRTCSEERADQRESITRLNLSSRRNPGSPFHLLIIVCLDPSLLSLPAMLDTDQNSRLCDSSERFSCRWEISHI